MAFGPLTRRVAERVFDDPIDDADIDVTLGVYIKSKHDSHWPKNLYVHTCAFRDFDLRYISEAFFGGVLIGEA